MIKVLSCRNARWRMCWWINIIELRQIQVLNQLQFQLKSRKTWIKRKIGRRVFLALTTHGDTLVELQLLYSIIALCRGYCLLGSIDSSCQLPWLPHFTLLDIQSHLLPCQTCSREFEIIIDPVLSQLFLCYKQAYSIPLCCH